MRGSHIVLVPAKHEERHRKLLVVVLVLNKARKAPVNGREGTAWFKVGMIDLKEGADQGTN